MVEYIMIIGLELNWNDIPSPKNDQSISTDYHQIPSFDIKKQEIDYQNIPCVPVKTETKSNNFVCPSKRIIRRCP